MTDTIPSRGHQIFAVVTAFLSLFAIVGVALYGLPRFYPFFVQELGWSRAQVTSGNAYSKIAVAIAFGFLAGRLVDRIGPRRLMLVGITMAGIALVGLSYVTSLAAFYLFYAFNALGYVCGGPLPNQVLLSRWFEKGRGKAMGVAYLGIGVGGALVPLLAYQLTQAFGWRGALRWLGVLMILVSLPAAYFVREPAAAAASARAATTLPLAPIMSRPAFYLLLVGSLASIGAVGGTMQNLALYLSLDRKLAQVDVDATLSLVLIGSVVGRLLMGWLADRWAKKRVMLLIYVIVAAAIPPLFYAPSAESLKVVAFLFGVGLGGDYMIIPLMAAELYGDKDAIADFEARAPFRVVEDLEGVTMELDVPFFDKSELNVFRHGQELYVQLGPYRRSFLLPDALRRREITRAKLDEGTLRVTFGKPGERV